MDRKIRFLSREITARGVIFSIISLIVLLFSTVYLYIKSDIELKRALFEANTKIGALENILASTTHDKSELADALVSEQQKTQAFSNEILQIQGTVGTLVKLSKTDPELLKKYSKVYFLNENYVPAKLIDVSQDYLSDKNKKTQMDADIWPFAQMMLEAAKRDGLVIQVASAYRSFSEQSYLKANYRVTYGTGANKFSADQGYSEHQLGTTLDFTTQSIGGNLAGFEKTDAYRWLNENAYKYGFILSYPKNNSYYIFEPWHWRFVSVALATTLHDNGKTFYETDQRTIDFYLVSFFDSPQ